MRKVTLVKPIGYCLGVIKAIEKAIKIKQEHKDQNVFIFGLLVHNEEVITYLNSFGLVTINDYQVSFEEFIDTVTKDDIVIFPAHGHKEEYEEKLRSKGITFYDTTCVNVEKNINLIKKYKEQGIIYIGKKNHKETIASLSVHENVILYDINEGLDFSKVIFTNPVVINQTTLSFLEINHIHQEIINKIPSALLLDEVCSATRVRQEKIKDIPSSADLIIIVGSNKSSNTQKLYEVASSFHGHEKVIKINNKNDLVNYDINRCNNIYLLSGTSTPIEIIEEIKTSLKGGNDE